jgi:hypothetical protein
MVEDVKQDVNGNGVFGENQEDLLAFGGYPNQSYGAFFTNQGLSLFSKDENNYPVYNGLSEQYYDFYMKLANFVSDKERVCFDVNFQHNFSKGLQMFYSGPIYNIGRDFRSMEEDFGLIPHPKADEESMGYYGTITEQIQPMCIPIVNAAPEETGIILENLAAESFRQVRDVYYNTLLEYKYVRDQKSIEMLDLIYSADTHLALEAAYSWADLANTMNQGLRSGADQIVSKVTSKENSISKAVGKTVDALS